MPARTLKAITDLIAHIPVDQFDIVDGPKLARCMQAMDGLDPQADKYADLTFTLKTQASNSSFIRRLKMATIYNVLDDGSFSFTAIFSNRIVSGVYYSNTRTGWFSLD
jgi:hypothetical protein